MLELYKGAYRMYCAVMPGCSVAGYKFISAESYDEDGMVCNRIVFDRATLIDVPPPQFIGEIGINLGLSYSLNVKTPSLDVIELCDATVMGGTFFIHINNYVIHPQLFDSSCDLFPAENFGVASVDFARGGVRLYLTKEPIMVERAISLLGQCAGNYAHFLTEVLPKLQIIDEISMYEEWPLLVDGWIHPTLINAIELLNINQREIIFVGRWQSVMLRNIVDVSLPGYEPYVPHKLFVKENEHYVNRFSRKALGMLRGEAHKLVSSCPAKIKKKIYLSRSDKSNLARGIKNAEELEKMFCSLGYKVIEPGSMGFLEQVSVCRDAEVIVAPVGASLANMIFAQPGCRILALAPYFANGNYFYYSNLANILGHELCYYLGLPVENGGHPRHRDYMIDIDGLREELGKQGYNA